MTARSLELYYKINGDTLERVYKDHLSGYLHWEDKPHADRYLVFPENFGPRMSIDETSTKDGELFTILSNKDGHGRKGSIAAIVRGTRVEDVSSAINLVPDHIRKQVGEVHSTSQAAWKPLFNQVFHGHTRHLTGSTCREWLWTRYKT